MTTYTGPCRYCAVPFTAATPRAYCSHLCRDRHRWFGVIPDAHRAYATRLARQTPVTAEETS